MPKDAVSRTANVERNGGHKWVDPNHNLDCTYTFPDRFSTAIGIPIGVRNLSENV